ncbi:hypothetical protein FBEOM_13418 [Fusarium beomiforme]|uniref:Uncharacterized protein n=1 Tax=Fusarium beomiforme TaxID=44412 RepID=A0A9P5A717_9HYPO|nr:hypothetical protein FBEOM_13418 [Fusarium beomiforme]
MPKHEPPTIISSDAESEFDDVTDLCLEPLEPLKAKEQPNDSRKEDESDEENNSSPDPDSQLFQTVAEHESRNAVSILFRNVQEESQATAHSSLVGDGSGQALTASSRKQVISLSMANQKIGNKIRPCLSSVASKKRSAINGRLAELNAEAQRARTSLVDARVALNQRLEI